MNNIFSLTILLMAAFLPTNGNSHSRCCHESMLETAAQEEQRQ